MSAMKRVESYLTPFEYSLYKHNFRADYPEATVNEKINRASEEDRAYVKGLIERIFNEKLRLCTDIANHEFIDATTEKVKLQVKTLHAGMPTEEYLQSSLVYGDIDFNSFGNILIRMKPLKGDIFVDLGSGTGRAVVYAHLLFGDTLKCSRGIEILPLLHQYAVDAVAGLPSKMLQHEALFAHHSAQYSVELGDFLAHDCFEWQTADLVFVNSTCFSDQMMASIQARALGLKKGSRVATLTRFFQSDAFVVTDTLNFTMSWGIATCFFHLRL